MDSQREEGQKKFILQNHYTRGQIDLFIEAEKRYGFDQVMDWMKYGEAGQLEAGHVDQLRDVKMPLAKPMANSPPIYHGTNRPVRFPSMIKLDGVMWSNRPVAIINGRSFLANDQNPVKMGVTNVNIRCLEIQKTSVRIRMLIPERNRNFACRPIEIPSVRMSGQRLPSRHLRVLALTTSLTIGS